MGPDFLTTTPDRAIRFCFRWLLTEELVDESLRKYFGSTTQSTECDALICSPYFGSRGAPSEFWRDL